MKSVGLSGKLKTPAWQPNTQQHQVEAKENRRNNEFSFPPTNYMNTNNKSPQTKDQTISSSVAATANNGFVLLASWVVSGENKGQNWKNYPSWRVVDQGKLLHPQIGLLLISSHAGAGKVLSWLVLTTIVIIIIIKLSTQGREKDKLSNTRINSNH